MKKNSLFMSVLAFLFMVGCSQEEIAPNDGDGDNGEANTSYMSVNLVSSDATGSRATGNGYEDGSTVENKVSKVRFYFFNGVGGTANVKTTANGAVNYYDWTNPTTAPGNPNDVEKILSATIVINTKEGDGLPVRIAAVLNPTQDLLDAGSMSLSTLKEKSADFAIGGLTSEGNFVMFNSVYLEGGKDYSTTDIKDKNICKTEKDAEANPVTIYVERSVAKVSVALGPNVAAAATADGKIALKDKVANGENLTIGGKQVYLKLGGWELAAETSKGRLVKKINPAWEGTWWWEGANSPRTFWAINEMTATNVYDKNYDQISTAFGETNYLYTNENAQKNDINNTSGGARNNTKVIVKGSLVDADNKPFTIVRHMGSHFADDPENFNNLKESILKMLENKEYFYYHKEGDKYQQITVEDLDVIVPTTITAEDSKNCYVYTQLNSTAAARTTWYKSTVKDPIEISAYKKIDASEINNTLKDKKSGDPGEKEYIIDRPLVWKSGMTYYYYEIKHLQESNETGVVRNHIYKTTITNIAGLGTPVYNPGDVIYPEKPSENDHYIAAEIKILSWRVVNNNYDLEW
ncbi:MULTISPECIES: Mfa1 family fimbria major subunit [Butyricimonas]|uniref:Mfa1 family fimbria major subunit n=1 Tax=Butyricimonas TaxID=574697 RepID=UPI0007FB5B90|nr:MULTISPECIES: Mfa1 family fimbria major subunit [Butyricimonas]